MIEKVLFYGGINSDDEDRFLPDGDYRYALNIRNSKGAIENTKGNTLVSFTLPTGLNKCIGGKYDEVNNRVIYFIWNLLSNHSIIEYDVGTGSVASLMQSSVLNFNKDYPILHCEIIDDLCYCTDKYNPERKINISRAKSGGYTTIDEQVISRIQYAPNYSPTVQYGTDANTKQNLLQNKVFQFRYAYVYEDNEISSTSPVSKIALTTQQYIYTLGEAYDITYDNYLEITFQTGIYLCKKIKLYAREGNTGDWYLIKDFDKTELGIANNSTHTYNFYNNESSIVVTQAEVNKLFDNVPLKTGAISLVDGNRLVSSDVTEGFDNIDITGNTATPVYFDNPEQIDSTLAVSNTGASYTYADSRYSGAGQTLLFDINVIVGNYQSAGDTKIRINALNTHETDVWFVRPYLTLYNTGGGNAGGTAGVITSFTDNLYSTFPAGSTSFDIATYFANAISSSTKLNGIFNANIDVVSTIGLATTATVSNIGGGIYEINIHYSIDPDFGSYAGTVNNTTQSLGVSRQLWATINGNVIKKTFKRNSRHSFSMVYYDSPNRSGVCQVTDTFDVTTLPFSGASQRGWVEMDISINNTPPSWATHYQILYTGNRSVSNYIQTLTQTIQTPSSSTVKIYLYLEGFNNSTNNKATNSYSWTKGDRVTFIFGLGGVYLNDYYDTEIISSGTDGTGQYIIISNIDLAITPSMLIELYTPKLTQEQVLYWEIGEVYPITGGYHTGSSQNQTALQPAIVRVNSGDSYYRFRGGSFDSFIEDLSISDFYTSNYWDKGRFNVIDKDYKQIRRYATSYYSESYIPDTNINGLSTVYDLNFHEANKNYGAIQRTYAEQDRLLFFQEKRTGFSLVNKNLLYNSDGTPNGVVGQASQVLSDVQYYAQDYGIGDNPESLTVNGTRKYHVDPYKGYVLRLSIDGYTEISEYKCHVLFQDIFNQRKKFTDNNRGKIWGVYDRRVDEYILSFESCSEPPQVIFNKEGIQVISGFTFIQPFTLSFSEEKKRWVTYYSYNPDFMLSNGIDILTWENGLLYTHNTNSVYNNFYGDQYNSVVRTVTNQDPSNVKNFISMFEESTDVWSMTATTPGGQATSLVVGDFEINEGVWYSALLKDSNTPNVLIPLIEGDDMRDASMTIELTNDNTTFTKLFAINVRYVYSEMTNK